MISPLGRDCLLSDSDNTGSPILTSPGAGFLAVTKLECLFTFRCKLFRPIKVCQLISIRHGGLEPRPHKRPCPAQLDVPPTPNQVSPCWKSESRNTHLEITALLNWLSFIRPYLSSLPGSNAFMNRQTCWTLEEKNSSRIGNTGWFQENETIQIQTIYWPRFTIRPNSRIFFFLLQKNGCSDCMTCITSDIENISWFWKNETTHAIEALLYNSHKESRIV